MNRLPRLGYSLASLINRKVSVLYSMITRLNIHNFQSHKKSTLEFHPGVNVIVGTSDSGKSAIIRALRWLIQGKPRGDSFRSWWGGDTSVEVTIESGSKIGRTRTNSDAFYYVNDLVFRATGNDIPDMVVEELNMDEINIQKQSDSPFLISETSGEVAAHFNRMANLEKIGTSIAYVTTELNRVKQRKEAKENELLDNRQQLRAFRYLDTLENALSVIEQLSVTISDSTSSSANLHRLMTKIHNTQAEINNLRWVDHAAEELSNLSDISSKFKDGETKALQLEGLTVNIHRTTKRITIITKLLSSETLITEISDKTADIQAKEQKAHKLSQLITSYRIQQENSKKTDVILSAESTLSELADINHRILQKKTEQSKLRTLHHQIKRTLQDIDDCVDIIIRYEDTFQNEMPAECPLCSSNIPHAHE